MKNIILAALLLAVAAIVVCVGKAIIGFASDPEQFREWVQDKGALGVLTIMALAALQAIAVLPAGPVQVAGGYAYGVLWGTIYFTIGCTIGSMIVFLMVRRFGRKLVLLFFDEKKVNEIEKVINRPKWKRIFVLIFLIPGAPKDAITYCAGMTDIKPWIWLLVCSLGRLPGTLLSAFGGSAMLKTNYTAAAVIFGTVAASSIIGLWMYKKKMK